jgi:hypothetical protein
MIKQSETMEMLIQQIIHQQKKIDELLLEESGPVLRPGASSQIIAQLEETFNFRLPPSYKEFLMLHDGWRHFTGTLDLLGSKEFLSTDYVRRVKEIQTAEWGSGHREPVEGFVIGYGGESSDILFISRTAPLDKDEERSVVLWKYEEVSRVQSFRRFLEFWIEVNENKLQTLRSWAAEESTGEPDL